MGRGKRLAAGREAERSRFRLYRFQNCHTLEPLLLSGIFLKKMPPFTPPQDGT